MAGTARTPALPAGIGIPPGTAAAASLVNSLRVTAVAERLSLHVLAQKNDSSEFFNLCLALARGIDYAVANNEVPSGVQDLPLLLKQVCQRKNECVLQAAIMVLMISVKNACKIGRWFAVKDCEELLTIANEVGSSFCSVKDLNTEVNSSLEAIATIMSRFYPKMKMGQILAFLEVKPGYGTYVSDFLISKDTKLSAEDKIRLFVARTDNLETSSCIITPPQVSFLLNGKGVDRRTNVFMDTGPQLPTNVTHLLKYGTNMLQTVGEFNGNYIIVIAYTSNLSEPGNIALHDYVQPAVTAPDSDSELIEGPSRISLNCPISFKRIKVPVKGYSCNHWQCFDFHNYVDINSRRPSWRCPHCRQYVCYVDLRIDQNVAKVLKEVAENVTDIIISADGSWKALAESNDDIDQPNEKTTCQQDGPVQQKAPDPPDIVDLTENDDNMDVIHVDETQETKPSLFNLKNQSTITDQSNLYSMNYTGEGNQNAAPIDDDFWSGILSSTLGSGVSSALGSISVSAPSNFMPNPVLTDAVSPVLVQETEAFQGSALLATSLQQNQIPAPANVQLQHSQFGNSVSTNEYGSIPNIPRHINRTPIAVQALPAPSPGSASRQRPRISSTTLTIRGSSLASQTSAMPSIVENLNATCSATERQQQFSSHLNPPHLSSSSLQQHLPSQNWDHQDRSFISNQAAQTLVGVPTPNLLSNAYRASARTSDRQSFHQHQPQPLNLGASPSLVRSSSQLPPHFTRSQIPQGNTNGVASGTSPQITAPAQRASQMPGRAHPVPGPTSATRTSSFQLNADRLRALVGDQRGNMGASMQPPQPPTRTDNLQNLQTEQNWRPTGRMRGALSGQAYSDALNQLIIQPTQTVQAARPPLVSPPPGIPSQLHVLVANNWNAHPPQVNYPLIQPNSIPGVPDVLPEQSSGLR
ncbi:hypothetical protein NMG60_11030487 [Bertholletia excelsa]